MKVCKCINVPINCDDITISVGELYKYKIISYPSNIDNMFNDIYEIYSYDEKFIIIGFSDESDFKFDFLFEDLIESRKRKINNLFDESL